MMSRSYPSQARRPVRRLANRISMSWPEYQIALCRLDGKLLRLTDLEAELILMLLLTNPCGYAKIGELVERLWPNDDEPDTSDRMVRVLISRLRRMGVPIETLHGWGYLIAADRRGRPERERLAA